MPYYVYIIVCEDGSFYTGYTRNVESRMRLHRDGKGARYTRIHKPRRLVYTEAFSTRSEAMKRERKIKTMRHGQKRQLAKTCGKHRQCPKRTESATCKL